MYIFHLDEDENATTLYAYADTVKPVHSGMPWDKVLFRFGKAPV